jgi:hypothetical protein
MPHIIDPAKAVVIADTCSILDLVRTADRHESLAGETSAAKQLIRHITFDGSSVAIAICDVTVGEFDANIEKVVLSARQGLAGLRKRINHAHMVALEHEIGSIVVGDSRWDVAMIDAAERLAREILQSSAQIASTDTDRTLAFRTSSTASKARLTINIRLPNHGVLATRR